MEVRKRCKREIYQPNGNALGYGKAQVRWRAESPTYTINN